MKGKWVFATGVVLALLFVAAVGGVTVRAFAGVAVQTKTVTRFCVYVDRHNTGNSYGDVSVIPKYQNRVCIAGKPGDTSVITWNKTIPQAVGGAPKRFAGLGGIPAGQIELAKVGPFSLRGACTSGDGVRAGTGRQCTGRFVARVERQLLHRQLQQWRRSHSFQLGERHFRQSGLRKRGNERRLLGYDG